MTNEKMIEIFKRTNALLNGHFELSSGKHSDTYFQCSLVLQYPEHAETLARELAKHYANKKITCVIGPALGGVTIAYELARQLKCRGIFAERKEGRMQIRRGFSLSREDRVLLVEDVITTGGSVLEVARLVAGENIPIAGIGCIVNRSTGDVLESYPLASLMRLIPQLYEPTECPLCKTGVPITKPGSKSLKK